MTEDEMVEWHHRLNGHEFEQTPRDSEGQGSLACCSLWGGKEWGHNLVTEQQTWNYELLSFCGRLILLSIMSSKLIHLGLYERISFF